MRVRLLYADSIENTVDGKRLTVIVKCLSVGDLQQLKICTQIASNVVCGLVFSCVPSRMPVNSAYPGVQLLCPLLELPLRSAQLKGFLSRNVAAFVEALRDPSRLDICVYIFWPYQTMFSAGFACNESTPMCHLDTMIPALILRRFRRPLSSLHFYASRADAG